MRAIPEFVFFCLILLAPVLAGLFPFSALGEEPLYDERPPFRLTNSLPREGRSSGPKLGEPLFGPGNPYNIFINYELGMHCVGFDVSYCCIIPPYNSVQAQAVRSGAQGAKPQMLTPADDIRLDYRIADNTYSEGNKMKYWRVLKDVSQAGRMDKPGDNMANYVWTHLFIYKDLEGTLPARPETARRLRVGMDIPVNIDAGPTGKSLAGGEMTYAGAGGGNIVFTDSLLPAFKNIPLTLTSSYLWDALGLPLTAFSDSRRTGSIRTISDRDFQPYQASVVQMKDARGHPVLANGKPVEFFGTNPVDISNCQFCHSGDGLAALRARKEGLTRFDAEFAYWKKNYPDTSDYIARLSATMINILEIHDKHHQTRFLADYDPAASSNRLGKVGAVNCTDCHGDNISGNLETPRPQTTGYRPVKSRPLTESVHAVHAQMIPLPDRAGRTQSCQVCHPSHWQDETMNDWKTNPYQMTDTEGRPRFTDADLRTAGGGCFLRRDAHANPHVTPPFFLNDIGKWYLQRVSQADEEGRPVKDIRGLYCTHCHNHLSRELYRLDDLTNAVSQEGKTLRNQPITDVIRTVAGDEKRFRSFFADPTVDTPGNPLFSYYADHPGAVLGKTMPGKDGKPVLLPWNDSRGEILRYAGVSGGSDWWLSPGAPHCADCHAAPFVESAGGGYFPIDQPRKYALYRYSRAHARLACQSCHESMHGLYPVRRESQKETVDMTSHNQALQFSPDGRYAGPVTCAACHTVNARGVPVQLGQTRYFNDYWASVVLIHFMRDEDVKLTVAQLIQKYPYQKAREIVWKGWK